MERTSAQSLTHSLTSIQVYIQTTFYVHSLHTSTSSSTTSRPITEPPFSHNAVHRHHHRPRHVRFPRRCKLPGYVPLGAHSVRLFLPFSQFLSNPRNKIVSVELTVNSLEACEGQLKRSVGMTSLPRHFLDSIKKARGVQVAADVVVEKK